jgi:glucuronoarabinoxylan endo-1,4-beta-xylanase
MSKLLTVFLLGLLAIVNGQQAAEINPGVTYQLIRGLGGINLPDWIADLSETQTRKAFTNGADCLGFSILRVFVSDNSNAWSKSVKTAKLAQSLGAVLFATPWNPPSYMTENFSGNGRSGKRLKKANYGDYANHLNNFVKYMKGQGVTIYAISVQNEPDYAHEWTWWTPEECVDFLANHAGKITGAKVMSPETFQYNKNYYNAILKNANANRNVHVWATHFYGTQRSQMDFPALEQDSREIWMTEVYVPNSSSDADTWPEAVEVAVNIHNAFVVGGMSVYTWWYIRRSYSPLKENGNISKRGYMMAQFSKYVRPGAVRISATEQPASGVYISAYKNYDGKLVVVCVNNGSQSYAQRYNFKNFTVKSVNRYMTSSSGNLAETKNLAITNNGFYAQTNSKTVSTFVIS